MPDTGCTERAYRTAEGFCLDAIQSLRRFSGREALESLQAAIRLIEDDQRQAKREESRLRYIPPVAPPPYRGL